MDDKGTHCSTGGTCTPAQLSSRICCRCACASRAVQSASHYSIVVGRRSSNPAHLREQTRLTPDGPGDTHTQTHITCRHRDRSVRCSGIACFYGYMLRGTFLHAECMKEVLGYMRRMGLRCRGCCRRGIRRVLVMGKGQNDPSGSCVFQCSFCG